MYTEFKNAMYTKVNNIEFIDMTDKNKFIYLMKYQYKDVSQYIELAWDKELILYIIVHDFIFLLLVWLNLHNII